MEAKLYNDSPALLRIVDQRGEYFRTVPVVAFSADGSLALHRTASDGLRGWSVSHVRTGAQIADGIPFRDAERILDKAAHRYGKELRRIRFAGKPLARSIKAGVALIIRETMGNRSPQWAMEA